MASSSISDLDNGNTQGLVPAADPRCIEKMDNSNQSEGEDHSVRITQLSESKSSKSSEEEETDNEPFQQIVRHRRDMRAKDLDIGNLFNTKMFQNKQVLVMAKILRTVKDAIALTEYNVDLAIDSRGTGLSSTD